MSLTPIADFVREYAAADVSRLHMPGHKGRGPLGCEALDLTEIAGADGRTFELPPDECRRRLGLDKSE